MLAGRDERHPVARRIAARPRWTPVRAWTGFGAALVAAAAVLVAGSGYEFAPMVATDGATSGLRHGSAGAHTAPRGNYIVVDRANNRLYLRNRDTILLDAACSAGSGATLIDPRGDREWVFDTPSGMFRILGRIRSPAWSKPDWAFVEEGRPVPSEPSERIEYGVLGEYALDLGDGYLIHGTLYERLLGRSVTHGCIRLGRDDLRTVWAKTTVGTTVYIF